MDDDIDTDEPKPKMCERCGGHPDDLKCLDHHVGDELRPMQTKLCRMPNAEAQRPAIAGTLDGVVGKSYGGKACATCVWWHLDGRLKPCFSCCDCDKWEPRQDGAINGAIANAPAQGREAYHTAGGSGFDSTTKGA